ncbi:mechanosensitive ion channel family protein [Bdellovibrio bacteriovorus]|uniref:mechanosensitive ion channel family protein n=1 Tax=Bdellovibrio bacteriovorus TaxID=959 RepID=UPI0035A71ECC
MLEDIKYSDFGETVERLMDGPWKWLIVLAFAIVLSLAVKTVLKFIEKKLLRLAKRTRSQFDDMLVSALGHTRRWVIFVWLFVPMTHSFKAEPQVLKVLNAVFLITTLIQVGIWGMHAITRWKDNYLQKKMGNDPSAVSALGLVSTMLRGVLILALTLVCLSNLGVDIGALIAGLGIGGIAVALAAQNILGDMFASLSIVLDKPFVVGDFITVGQQMGTVETIGIKTTHVRALSGEELIFSNKDLLESRIQNFKRMWRRRVVLSFGVPYDLDAAKLEALPLWMKEAVGKHSDIEFERCHLASYGSYSLNYETVYWVKNPDFNLHMDIQQRVLLDLLKKMREEKVSIAIPRQSLDLENLPKELAAKDASGGIRELEH